MRKPVSASSCAIIAAVHPKPTKAMSTGGSFCTICLSLVLFSLFGRFPARPAPDADGRQVELLAVAGNVRTVVVVGAGKTDQLPARHVLVAAIEGIGEEALDRVLHQHGEERVALGALDLE